MNTNYYTRSIELRRLADAEASSDRKKRLLIAAEVLEHLAVCYKAHSLMMLSKGKKRCQHFDRFEEKP